MSDPSNPTTPSGWYPDGQGSQRYWDGTQWTEHVQPAQPQQPQQAPYQQQAQQPQWQQPGGVAGGQSTGTGGGGSGKLIALIGSGVLALVLAITLVVVLFKVVGGGSPESVAKDYLDESLKANLLFDGDYAKLCEMRTEDSQESLLERTEVDDCEEFADDSAEKAEDIREEAMDECEHFEDLIGDLSWDIEITEVDENDDGDEATAEYEIDYTFDGDEDKLEECDGDASEFGETEDGELTLVKEDGDWKVDD